MKISYNWLKKFIAIDLAPRDLAEELTMVGLAVDGVEAHDDDFVLEIDLTSNRPDCLSHYGVAREVAAITGKPLQAPNTDFAAEIQASEKTSDFATVEILAPSLCPRYTARIIKGVKIGPSPEWLVKRLEAMGQRSVNNVADITNYVMLELGQPLHAFDLKMVRGQKIIVRNANAGEKMITLDGEERVFAAQMLLIADSERAVAIGGIKGGEDSGITDSTTDVLLEAAYFTPAQIRATSKTLGLATEASYRFERGTDPEMVPIASARAAKLIAEIAGGKILDGLIDVYPQKAEPRPVSLRLAKYRTKTSLDISLDEATEILRALGLNPQSDATTETIQATAPTWRIDIGIEEDLIEEVARISGYDKLTSTLPGSAGAGAYLQGENGRRAVRNTLTTLGYHEAVSFSFVNAENDTLLTLVEDNARLKLSNPIDTTQAEMRTTLLGGLLEAVTRNLHHGTRNIKLFEIGKCFVQQNAVERPLEPEKIGLAITGARNENDWQTAAARLDFYDLKGAVESVAESLQLTKLNFAPSNELSYLHPGRAAVISVGSKTVGHLGQLHPSLASRFKFKQPVFIAELDLGMMLVADAIESRYQPLPKFPTVLRDIAILIERSINWAEIEEEIKTLALPQLEAIRLFDLYAGKELPAGKHSLALSLRFRAVDRTLTEAEINLMYEQVVQKLRDKFGAELR